MFLRWFLLLGLAILLRCFAHAAPVLSWTNTLLTVRDPRLPGGKLEVWYLEAFCRAGGHARKWDQTRVQHQTTLTFAAPDGAELRFRTLVETNVEVLHEVRAGDDGLELTFLLTNRGPAPWDIQWFQPACVRVADFTGRDQQGYLDRSFVFTEAGLTPLSRMQRTTNALYLGGQVYLPPGIREADANPRPVARNRVTNGLIGCFSGDDRWLLAIASDRTFELFEGVYVCLHSDPLIDGLKPGESKRLRQRIYLLPNDPAALFRRYRADFPRHDAAW
jgi:hypothetical protein